MSTIAEEHAVELAIGGMSCASCATRIEKKLNKLDGVTATVNFATETARVAFPFGVTTGDLISVVEKAGYTAAVAVLAPGGNPPVTPRHGGTTRPPVPPGQRLMVSLALAIPVVVLAMVPVLQFRDWQWASLVLASPVAVWGAWPFHRTAIVNARHGAATMDTPVSVGVAAAHLWSVYALLLGSGSAHTYLEVAAGVTALILLGRYLEARVKRRSGAALRALLSLGAKEVAVMRNGAELRLPAERLAIGDEFVVRPGEKIDLTLVRDGVQLGVRGHEQPAAAPVPGRWPPGSGVS